MRCSRCGYDNPEGLEVCRNCSAPLSGSVDGSPRPSWNLVSGPKWSEPDFSADTVSEDDVPADFDYETETVRLDPESDRRTAARVAAERARRAAEEAAAKREAEEQRAAERRAADERRAAERREQFLTNDGEMSTDEELYAVDQVKPRDRGYDDETDDFGGYEADESEEVRRPAKKGVLPFLGDLFQHKKKPAARARGYEDEYDEDEDFEPRPYRKSARPAKGKSGSLNLAIKIAGIVAVIAIIAIGVVLIAGSVKRCSNAASSPTGTSKTPVIEKNPDDESSYFVTVYAKEGKVLVYETADGTRKDVTVPASGFVKFRVPVSSLMPTEPIDGSIYQAVPKVYIKNDDGTETLVDGMEPILLQVPALNVRFDQSDAIVSDDGKVEITGRIDLIATKLTIGGEDVYIDQDGSFSHTLTYDEPGDYTLEVEGRLAGHQIYRKSFSVTVTQATSTTVLVELPWEYGDAAFSQRVRNNVDTIEVRGRVPAGSQVTVTCESTNATITVPTVAEDGTFTFSVKMAYAGDYTLMISCLTESGKTSTREMHVQRAPEWSTYTSGAMQMNYASFAYSTTQAYKISGKVTEIIKSDDYILAVLEIEGGKTIVLEYHNHYNSAGTLAEGRTYTKIYGRPMGLNEDGIPQIYVWFVDD